MRIGGKNGKKWEVIFLATLIAAPFCLDPNYKFYKKISKDDDCLTVNVQYSNTCKYAGYCKYTENQRGIIFKFYSNDTGDFHFYQINILVEPFHDSIALRRCGFNPLVANAAITSFILSFFLTLM